MIDLQYDNAAIRKKCERAKGKLKQRLDDMRAAENMSAFPTLTGNHHALHSNLAGFWSCHLEEPKRLIYKPLGDPLPMSKDGHLDLSSVTAIMIVEIKDYHGN